MILPVLKLTRIMLKADINHFKRSDIEVSLYLILQKDGNIYNPDYACFGKYGGERIQEFLAKIQK